MAAAVYDILTERIMDQALAPGTRVNIDALAAELGYSQTPIQEALVRLTAERLVDFVPFKGYWIAALPTPRRIAHLLHVRIVLASETARLAAEARTPGALRRLERELVAMEALRPTPRFRDFRSYTQHDQRFHELLVGASGNEVLAETFRGLNVHVQLARFVHEFGKVDHRENMVEHRTIFAAVRAGDPAHAAAGIQSHIGRYAEALAQRLDEQAGQTARLIPMARR